MESYMVGKISCHVCEGSGQTEKGRLCTCPHCQGEEPTKKDCPTCNHTGKVYVKEPKVCWACKGTGWRAAS